MIPDKVIYTDGRDVTVTNSVLKVRNSSFSLSGITRSSLWTKKAQRWPGILLLLVGAVLVVCGLMELLPSDIGVRSDRAAWSANTLAVWGGIALFVIGLIWLALARDRYAVRIATAEGEKNAVVSTRRDYIAQIVDAIHKAFSYNSTMPTTVTSSGHTLANDGDTTYVR